MKDQEEQIKQHNKEVRKQKRKMAKVLGAFAVLEERR